MRRKKSSKIRGHKCASRTQPFRPVSKLNPRNSSGGGGINRHSTIPEGEIEEGVIFPERR